MSTRGVDFLHRWVEENLAGFHQVIIDEALVTAMADRCLAEARAAGIARDEFEEEFGTVETVIREAIAHDPADEVTPHMRFGLN